VAVVWLRLCGAVAISGEILIVSSHKVDRIFRLLQSEYGHPQRKNERDPLSELIATILSQNTSDLNSHRAFGNLKERFPTWEEARKASQEEIAEAIKVGGLFNEKARRIRALLEEIHQQEGGLDLSFLSKIDSDRAQRYLLQFKGVGPKTAACVQFRGFG